MTVDKDKAKKGYNIALILAIVGAYMGVPQQYNTPLGETNTAELKRELVEEVRKDLAAEVKLLEAKVDAALAERYQNEKAMGIKVDHFASKLAEVQGILNAFMRYDNRKLREE